MKKITVTELCDLAFCLSEVIVEKEYSSNNVFEGRVRLIDENSGEVRINFCFLASKTSEGYLFKIDNSEIFCFNDDITVALSSSDDYELDSIEQGFYAKKIAHEQLEKNNQQIISEIKERLSKLQVRYM